MFIEEQPSPFLETMMSISIVIGLILLISVTQAFVINHPNRRCQYQAVTGRHCSISFSYIAQQHSSSRSLFPSSLHAIATFGMGCFWKPSEELLKYDGVIETICGYTGKTEGGVDKPPNYDDVCFGRDWVEAVRVEYDEDRISYEQLLEAFFEAQEPKIGSRQYASIIFPNTVQQDHVAQQWLMTTNNTKRRKDGVTTSVTSIESPTPFYRAENYHQRYWQKTRPRLVITVLLLAIGSGFGDQVTPIGWIGRVHSIANLAVLLGMLYVLLERKLDTKTVELS